jgi:hypothetical protein
VLRSTASKVPLKILGLHKHLISFRSNILDEQGLSDDKQASVSHFERDIFKMMIHN